MCAIAFYGVGTLYFLPDILLDQIMYISQGRHLSDFGHFIIHGQYEGMGTTIFPGMLLSGKTRLHMPGYILMIASSFKLFGVSGFTAVLPNLLGYICTTFLIFYCANKLYDQQTGLLAALLFALLPTSTLFGTSALMEMSLAFMSALTFAIIMNTPKKWLALSILLAIGVNYLFRQSAVTLLIPLLAFYYDQSEKPRALNLFLIVIGALILTNLLSIWQSHEGLHYISYRGSLREGHVSYDNAFAETAKNRDITIYNVFYLTVQHTISNIIVALNELTKTNFSVQYVLNCSFAILMSFTTLTIHYGFRKIKKQLFPIACGLFTLALITATVIFYNGKIQYLHRMSFFTLPYLFIQSARAILGFKMMKKQKAVLIFIATYTIICLLLSFICSHKIKQLNPLMISNQQFLERIQPVKNQLLVCETTMTCSYNFDHYPDLVSFIPMNAATLTAINKLYPIGTIIIPDFVLTTRFTEQDINKIGLHFVEKRHHKNRDYLIYKRSQKNKFNMRNKA